MVRNLPALARVVMERVELKGETSMSRKSSTAIFAICGAVINSTSAVCRYILASGLHEVSRQTCWQGGQCVCVCLRARLALTQILLHRRFSQ